jgi:RNA polymerase sigma-70 factor (ECF subfamily)
MAETLDPPGDGEGQRGGDREPFEDLFRTHYRQVVFFFVRRGVRGDEAEDLAQETFIRAYHARRTLRDSSTLKPWLFSVATNVLRNALRHRAAAKRVGPEVSLEQATAGGTSGHSAEDETAERINVSLAEAGDSSSALSHLLTLERRELLDRALDELPPRMRQAVSLRVGLDLKYREIAAALNISIDTVKSQLGQARARLELLLGEHFTDIDFG